MKIVIVTNGSQGDVQPFLALAVGLKQAGHAVRLAAPTAYREWIQAQGVEHFPLGEDQQEYLQSHAVRQKLEGGGTLGFRLRRVLDKQKVFYRVNTQAWAACQGAEAIVYRIGGYLAVDSIAERLGARCFKAGLLPLTRTRAFPTLYLGERRQYGATVNYASHLLAEQFVWQVFRRQTNLFRRKELGLRPLPLFGARGDHLLGQYPVLYGFSPAVIPPPADWPENVTVTGYWFLEQSGEWQPPEGLTAFIEKKPRPVYIGFGSMVSRDPERTQALIRQALAQTGLRAVIASGWAGLVQSGNGGDEYIYTVKSAPHGWLFPRVAAVVHHGGAGTTAEGLRAGRPAVVVPHNYDQPFWGGVVAGLGVGPQPIRREQLSAARLAEALQTCLADGRMQEKADEIGRRIRGEEGVRRAVEKIVNN